MTEVETKEKRMSQLAHNILAQPESLELVLEQQRGQGLEALNRAASLLRSAKRVLITGIGASMFASIPLEYLLCSHGVDAMTIEAGELLHYRHNAFREAVAVVVSRSGESIEVRKLLALLEGRQLIIGVTNEPESLLAQSADVTIHIGSPPDEMVAIQTYTGTVLALHLLGSAVTNEFEAASMRIEGLRAELSQLVEASFEEMRGWDDFLLGVPPVYLLARGPSCASALEGALLFNEVAKTPAVGMPTASFRHGPVELVDENFRGIIFAPEGDTQDLNLALARDLTRFGGRVRVLGPAGKSITGLQWCDVPAIPETLAPLFEIVPVRVAALRMAQLRGISPGSFRYAAQVATDESSFSPPKEGCPKT